MPDKVHEVGGVLAVVNRKGRIQADLLGVFAQQPGADAVIGSGPGQRVRRRAGIVAHHLARDAFDPPGHLGRGAPGKRHQQDPPRVGALNDQMGHAVGEGVGFPRIPRLRSPAVEAPPILPQPRARRHGAARD